MAIAEDHAGRRSPFERLLDAFDDEDDFPSVGIVGSLGAERVWPRAGAPLAPNVLAGESVENLYAESLVRTESARPAEKPEKPALAADFEEIRRRLADARSLDELRRLRRRFAFVLHPDRASPLDRSLAEKFMAEVNAAIDRAIRDKSSVT